MVKILSFFSLADDDYLKKAERIYVFPFMNGTGFYNAYGGSSYFIMVKYRDQ